MSQEHYWDQIIDFEARKSDLEQRLPNVSDLEFEEYVMLIGVLGPIYQYLTEEKV